MRGHYLALKVHHCFNTMLVLGASFFLNHYQFWGQSVEGTKSFHCQYFLKGQQRHQQATQRSVKYFHMIKSYFIKMCCCEWCCGMQTVIRVHDVSALWINFQLCFKRKFSHNKLEYLMNAKEFMSFFTLKKQARKHWQKSFPSIF